MTALRSIDDVKNGTKCAHPPCLTIKRPGGPRGTIKEGEWQCCAVHPTAGGGRLGRDPDLAK